MKTVCLILEQTSIYHTFKKGEILTVISVFEDTHGCKFYYLTDGFHKITVDESKIEN